MGYNTIFTGEIKFNQELTGSQLAKIKSFLGEDAREHPEWNASGDLDYIDLVMLDDFSGLKWNDKTEKTYGMIEMVNFLTEKIKEDLPEFEFTGGFNAQGEDFDDIWQLTFEKGMAVKREVPPPGQKIECPHCGMGFYLKSE